MDNEIPFTFGIITAGGEDENEHIPQYEVLIVGDCGLVRDYLKVVPFDETVHSGWITKKKNIVTQEAQYDNVVYMHDYIALCPGWYNGFKLYGDGFGVVMTRMLNPDGSRFSDWLLEPELSGQAIPEKSHLQNMLPYDITHLARLMYISGAYWVAKREIMRRHPLDEKRLWCQAEDLDWSRRGREEYPFELNFYSAVILLKDHPMLWQDLSPELAQRFRELP